MFKRKIIAMIILILMLNMVIFNSINAVAISNDVDISKEEIVENDTTIKEQEDSSYNSLNEDELDNEDEISSNESITSEEGIEVIDIYSNDELTSKKEVDTSSDGIDIKEEAETDIYEEVVNEEVEKNPGIEYEVKVQNDGWQEKKKDNELAGTTSKSLKLEAIKINLLNLEDVSIKYQVHIQDIGWQSWKSDGEVAGKENKSLRIEAIRIQLESTDDYSIMYRAHVQDIGWQSWKSDGEMAGTEGQSLRIEAIQIKIVDKIKRSKICIETPTDGSAIYNKKSIDISGWRVSNLSSTALKIYLDDKLIDENKYTYLKRSEVLDDLYGYGTSYENPMPGFKCEIDTSSLSNGQHTIKTVLYNLDGELLKEESISFSVYSNFHISYIAHVQNVGWQKYVNENELSGTEGRALRLEAIKINLNNAPKGAKIKYRAHVQNIGWQNWKYDNQLAGTEGQSLRAEAIQIKLENLDEFTVEYQVHIQDIGWSQWYIDGETAGTVGQSKRIEAIRIRLVPKYKRRYVGIDVSVFNGSIDWNAVKSSGIDFAMIRVGFRGYGSAGTLVEDSRFRENVENAKKAGLKVGVYFVTQATNESEAIEEANWVIERIKSYKIDYPVALDVEYSSESNHNGRADRLDKNTRTMLIKRFCDKIQNAGYTPIIYLNVDWAYNFVNMSQLSNYDTWIAHYKNNPNLAPSYTESYTIWQYTSTGSVSGVSGSVDCNICYKKY